MLSDFFESMFRSSRTQTEPHLDHLLFAGRQRRQHFVGDLAQVRSDDLIRRIHDGFVFDEITQVRIFFFADRSLQRDRLLRNLQHLAHLRNRNVHLLRDLFAGRFAAQLLHQRARSTNQFIDRFDHVHRDSNRARLIGDGASDRLANPPGCIGGKLITAAPFELVHGLHQTDVAFLNQIEKLQPAVGVLLRNRNDQSQVGLDQFAFRLAGMVFSSNDRLQRALDFDRRDVVLLFDGLQTLLGVCHVFLIGLDVISLQSFLREFLRISR